MIAGIFLLWAVYWTARHAGLIGLGKPGITAQKFWAKLGLMSLVYGCLRMVGHALQDARHPMNEIAIVFVTGIVGFVGALSIFAFLSWSVGRCFRSKVPTKPI